MRQFSDFAQLDSVSGGTAVTIGNFDGLHLGHAVLLSCARSKAKQSNLEFAVLTFAPHPARVLAPRRAPPLLYSPADKRTLFRRAGVELLLNQQFDREFASLSPAKFVKSVLVDALNAKFVVVGHDFTFGERRKGKLNHLRAFGESHGFSVAVIEAQERDGLVLSSTKTRAFVLEGNVYGAAQVLGRPFHVVGTVVSGAQRGASIGFPTANLALESELSPRRGVYSGWLDWGEQPQPCVMNVGFNPTFSGTECTLEAHVIDRQGLDLYGKRAHLFFADRLRDERRFANIAALSAQIAADRDTARAQLSVLSPPASFL